MSVSASLNFTSIVIQAQFTLPDAKHTQQLTGLAGAVWIGYKTQNLSTKPNIRTVVNTIIVAQFIFYTVSDKRTHTQS